MDAIIIEVMTFMAGERVLVFMVSAIITVCFLIYRADKEKDKILKNAKAEEVETGAEK